MSHYFLAYPSDFARKDIISCSFNKIEISFMVFSFGISLIFITFVT